MRRPLAILAAVVLAVAALYWFAIRDRTVAPAVSAPHPAATLDSGEGPVAVAGSGALVRWFPLPEDSSLPTLPATGKPPKGGRLQGPMLEQVRVLAATPAALRPYVERSVYGNSGVDVVLSSGIELLFGDDTRARQKWEAAAAVLADPSLTALDYVNVIAPDRPTVGGSGHTLPTLE